MSIFDYGGGNGTSGLTDASPSTQDNQAYSNPNDNTSTPSTGAGDVDATDGLTTEDTQQQLDDADPNITYKSAKAKDELQKDLDMTAQASKNQVDDSPPVQTGPATTVDKFLEVVAKTFPSPEILSVNFEQKPGERIEKIKVKVKVTGDFLSDEWFWADFLKYFKLKVYMVPYMNTDNSDIYNVSLFSEAPRELSALEPVTFKEVQYFQPLNQPIPFMENKSGKLDNTYIYESTLDIAKPTEISKIASGVQDKESIGSNVKQSTSLVTLGGKQTPAIKPIENLKSMKAGIVARTFFDKRAFKDELIGKAADPILTELKKSINGKWDLVQFDINGFGRVTSADRYYGVLPRTNRLWNSAFDFSDDKQKYLATDNTGHYPDSPIIIFKEQTFNKSNWPILLMQEAAKEVVSKQPPLPVPVVEKPTIFPALPPEKRPNNEPKFEFNETLSNVFSEAYIAKQNSGEVSVSVSYDYLELFKHLSSVPDQLFDNIQKNIEGNIIKKINIIDEDGKFLRDGLYRYLVEIKVSSQINLFVRDNVEKLDDVKTKFNMFSREASKEGNIDPQTKESTGAFIESEGNGTASDLQMGVEKLFEVLEVNLLDFFTIDSFILKRRRIKNDVNDSEFETNAIDHQVTRATNQDEPDFFTEFDTQDISFQFGSKVPYTREQAMAYMTPENINPELIGQVTGFCSSLQKDLLSLIREENTPEAQSETQTGRKTSSEIMVENTVLLNGTYDAKKSLLGLSFGEPSEIKILNTEPKVVLDTVNYDGQPVEESAAQYIVNNYNQMDDNDIPKMARSMSPGSPDVANPIANAFQDALDMNFEIFPEDEFLFEQANREETSQKESDPVETLDTSEQKYATSGEDEREMEMDKPSVQNFFTQMGGERQPPPEVEMDYLAGYETDMNGKSIMMAPIYESVSFLTEEDRGRELLFRVKPTENNIDLPIYNEYFVTKVQ